MLCEKEGEADFSFLKCHDYVELDKMKQRTTAVTGRMRRADMNVVVVLTKRKLPSLSHTHSADK